MDRIDIDIRDLTIEYDSAGYVVRPIHGLDLQVASGELVLLLGASGSGKTTLLSALAAILRPTAGTIWVGDTEVTGLRGAALTQYRRHHVGVVFQTFNLVPGLTARDNVQAPLWAARVPAREARTRAEQLLDRVGLRERLDHRPGDLSGGQQQRVAIARALAHDPPLVLADEPTAHLDYIQVEGVLRLLRELAEPGRIVVVATHDERLLPLADRVLQLSQPVPGESRPPERLEREPGQVVFEQGDRSDLVYTIEDGQIEIVRQRADGTEESLAVLGPGRYFGELGPLFGLRRSATAQVVEHAVLTGYTPRDFRELVGSGRLAEAISQASG
ncbi:MAG TPA: ATP-binding cassette domain-containing protein [Actinomycetota bacterium]|jgi:putative ABC transport system ATP-binding protein|nr:ATP-binding cassette domain-containing protein [Actinomycetota bacterium]